MRMKAADTSASTATAAWTALTLVSRSWTTAEIDTFISDVSMTKTNIAAASRIPRSGVPPAPSSAPSRVVASTSPSSVPTRRSLSAGRSARGCRRSPDDPASRARSRSVEPPNACSTSASSRASSSSICGLPVGPDRAVELLEHGPQPADDLHRRGSVLPDLRHAELEVLRPPANGDEHTPVAVGTAASRAHLGRPDHAQGVAEMVDHLDGGRGIVHRRGERLDRDVDHDPDRERGILLDRALDPERDQAAQAALRRRHLAVASVDVDDRRAGGHEVPDRVGEHERAAVCAGEPHQPLAVEGLDRSRPPAADDQ